MSRKLYSERRANEWGESPAVRIRPCQIGDLDSVIALVTRAGLSTGGLEDQFGDAYVLAECSGDGVGCAGVETYGSFALLRSVVVISQRRRLGIGEILVADRLEWAGAQGSSMVYLLTETAAKYFERFGFEKVDRTEVPPEIRASREFSVICPETADVMSLCL